MWMKVVVMGDVAAAAAGCACAYEGFFYCLAPQTSPVEFRRLAQTRNEQKTSQPAQTPDREYKPVPLPCLW